MESEVTAAEIIAAAKLEAQNLEVALELRLRRMWKEDAQNIFRGQVSDILTHVETRLPNLVDKLVRPILDAANAAASTARNDTTEALNKHQARVSESIASAKTELENRITAIVIKVLKEYQVVDEDLNLNHHAVAYAISRINK